MDEWGEIPLSSPKQVWGQALQIRSRDRAGRRPARARDRTRGPPMFIYEAFGRGSTSAPTIFLDLRYMFLLFCCNGDREGKVTCMAL